MITSLTAIPNTHISIPLGIFIGLLASFIQSLGLTIQRKSHVLNEQLPEREQRAEYRRPLWLTGFAIFISSNILGSLVQIASLPVVILAPLGAVSLLWNALFARLILGDIFSPWMAFGTLFIAGGALLIAIFGIVPEPTRSLVDLLLLFSRPAFVAYFSTLAFAVLVCLIVTHITEYSYARSQRLVTIASTPPMSPAPHPSVLATGMTDTIATERTPLIDCKPQPYPTPTSSRSLSPARSLTPSLPLTPPNGSLNSRTPLLLALSYSSISGILSGMCLLLAKSGVELLVLTLRGDNQFVHWQAAVLLLGLGAFALLQLWYLHRALILADPTIVCPSAFCFYNLSSIINGLVYFDQFSLIPPLSLGLVGLGMIVLLGGVWIVSVHSGVGGVDVRVAWDGEAETEAIAPANFVEAEEQLSLQDDLEAGGSTTREPLQRVRRETLSESNVPHVVLSPPPRPATVFERIAPEDTGDEEEVLSQQSRGIPRSRADSSVMLSPTSATRRPWRRRMTQGGTSSERSSGLGLGLSLSPPLGGGLQIGLSPVSPGFSIVPKERRRLVSALSVSDVVEEVRRRTVSEGDVRRMGRREGERKKGGWEWLRRYIRR